MSTENEQLEKDMDAVVARTQQLVDEYHAISLDVTRLKGDVDGKVAGIASELKHLADRIPEKLSEDMIRMSLALDQLVKDVRKIGDDLRQDYVNRVEFEVLRVEHDQIKKLVWGFIAMVLTALAAGVIALVFRG